MEYKLSYFTTRGRGEIIRLLFAAAGVDFEDERLTREAWQTFRPETPMKAMPVLTVKGSGMACQTGSIARYLAKKFGFFGSDHWEELLIDEAVDCIQDMTAGVVNMVYEKDETKKEELKKAFEETSVPKLVDYFRLRMKDGENGYLVGGKLSLADIAIFNFVDAVHNVGFLWFHAYDDVMKHYELIKSNDGIATWLKNRPKD